MSRRQPVLRHLRRLKLRLSAGGRLRRLLVPPVEVVEFWLSHGFREVVNRSRMRLTGHLTTPPPVDYLAHQQPAESGPIRIPAAEHATTSIVIPVMDNAELTRACLASIVAQTPAGQYEVIVVDNGSAEPTRRMLADVDGLTVIRNDQNTGFVTACNQGAAAARGEFILFLNNDTVVLPGWLEALLRTFALREDIGAVGAKLIYPGGRLQEAGGIVWRDGDGWNYGHNEDPTAPDYNFIREVDYCSAACLVVRRPVLEALGGFDARYSPAFYEDTDLAFRMRELGFGVWYQPDARVVHFGGATAGTNQASGLKRYQPINRETFRERHAAALERQCRHDPELLRTARDRRGGLRVLVVDHMVPHHDQDSGSVRMMALLRILVELGHRVTFLPDNLAALEPYTGELQQMGIEVRYGPGDRDFVYEHGSGFDVAILCRAHVAAGHLRDLIKCKPRPFIIFDTVDLHHLREQRWAEIEQDAKLVKSAARTRDVELRVMRASRSVWVTSTFEADALRHYALPPVKIVPNIHTTRTAVPGFSDRRDIVFIGGFRHQPNEDAVLYFVREIFPEVLRRLPDLRFIVAGSHVPPSVSRLASDRVIVRGFVPHVEPLFDAARLSVAPLRYGAGVKGKVTQSLAWGLPVVATPIAAEGLDLVDRTHISIGRDPGEFASRVVELYTDEALWTKLAASGREHINQRLGYDAVRSTVASILAEASRHG